MARKSLFVQELRKVASGGGGPIGFGGAVAHVRTPQMMLVARTASANAKELQALADAGVQAVVLDDPSGLSGQPLPLGQAVSSDAWPESVDFALLEPDGAWASLPPEGAGRVLQVNADLPDSALRSLGGLAVDAVLISGAYQPASITIAQVAEISRVAGLTGKPVLAAVEGEADGGGLRGLRDAGVLGVLVEMTAREIERARAWRAAIEALPPRRSPLRAEALLPRAPVAPQSEEEEE